MTIPRIKFVDSLTGEEIEREMNESELAEWQSAIDSEETLRLEREAAEAEKLALRESAKMKLSALGLTDEEVSAIIQIGN